MITARLRRWFVQKMDWIPVVFIAFKVIVFGTCMFFAIKWHYDQGKKKKQEQEQSQQNESSH